MRLRPILILVGTAISCLMVSGSAGSARQAQVVVLTAKYSGTYRFQDDYVNTTPQQKGEFHTLETLSWTQTVNMTVVVATGEVQQVTKKLVAQGKLHQNDSKGFSEDCTITELKPPGKPLVRLDVTPSRVGTAPGINQITVFGVLPFAAGQELAVKGTNNNCNIYSSALQSNTETDGTVFPTFANDSKAKAFLDGLDAGGTFKLSALPKTLRHDSEQTSTSRPFGGTETASRSIHWTLDIGGAGSAPAAPPAGKPRTTPKRVRNAVLADVRNELVQALYPCLTAGAGAALFTTTPPIGVVVGGTMTAIAAPVCAIEIQIIRQLSLAYYDPPVPGYTMVASIHTGPTPTVRLPSCAQVDPSATAFCERLHADATAWLASFGPIRDVATALAVTIGRESAAAKAGDKTALGAQQRAALALVPKLGAALVTRRSTGAKLTATLKSGKAAGSLSKAQSTQAIGTLLAQLGAKGVSAAQMRSAASAALTPRQRDLLAVIRGS